jgi:AAA family ATPase
VVEVANSFLLTARISEHSKVVLYSLSSKNTTRYPTWLPSIQAAYHAHAVWLREIHINEIPVITSDTSEKGKKRDWLTLLVRETLGARLYLLYGAIVNES